MEPLFGFEDNDDGRRRMQQQMRETLARLEGEKVRLMETLASVADEQKSLVSAVRKVEKGQREALEGVEEHHVPEGQELTLADVEKWCQSAFWQFARTMAANPHAYFSRRNSAHESMYERVVQFVLDNGYGQRYGGSVYTCLDVELHDGKFFLWPMTEDPKQSEVLNVKPDSMRPEQ